MRHLAWLVVFAARGKPEAPPPPITGSAPVADGGPAKPVTGLSDELRTKICHTEPCGGDTSSIDIYRDGSGAIKKLYRLYGSCSHSPGIYFDPDGTQTELIPEKPIVPGSAEGQALQAKHKAQIGGLTKTDSISCRQH